MKINFLGTGGVFDYEYGSSSALVNNDGQTFLIDCGPSVYPTLCEHKLINSIDYILLTHLHGDHVGSLSQLILHLNLHGIPQKKAVILYPTNAFLDEIRRFLVFWLIEPSQFIDFLPLASARGVNSLNTTNKHAVGMQSYAYYFTNASNLLYYSGDLGDVNVTATFLKQRNERHITVYHEMHHLKGSAHVHYQELMEKLGNYDVYGYHCNPNKIPQDNTIPLVANQPNLLLR
jgi:ribonuclease BN (tRNA processing enzyme)